MELKGHTNAIYSLAFSPKVSLLVSGDYGGAVKIWNPETGQEIRTLLPERDVQSYFSAFLAFNSNGNLLATGPAYVGDEVRVWDCVNWQEIAQWYADEIGAFAWSPDGSLLACATTQVVLYQAEAGSIYKKLAGEAPEWITSLVWSPDGKSVVAGCSLYDPAIVIWDVETGKIHTSLSGERQPIRGDNVDKLFFLNDTEILYTCGYGTLVQWNIETGEAKELFDAHARSIGGLDLFDDVTADGRYVAYAKQEGSLEPAPWLEPKHGASAQYFQAYEDSGYDVHVVNVSTGETKFTFKGHDDSLGCMAFSPDGRFLASGGVDGRLFVWNLQ